MSKWLLMAKQALVKFIKIMDYRNGMLFRWVERYNEEGIDGLQNKRKPGNPLVKYSKRKELTEIEQLEYENMLLRI